MSNKYISQINNTNFVYPNFELAEYDVDITHNINNNSVTGVLTDLSISSVSSTSITFSTTFTWVKNNAEIYINNSNNLNIVSFHLMTNDKPYFKPWRNVYTFSTSGTTSTTVTTTTTFTVIPSMVGQSVFQTGNYYFEVRFIGANSIYPVCQTLSITVP